MDIVEFQRRAKAIFDEKQQLYGRNNVNVDGVLGRIKDKLARLEHLSCHMEGEAQTDACLDLSNYAYILCSLLDGSWHGKQDIDRSKLLVVGAVSTPAKPGDAGFDLRVSSQEPIGLLPGKITWVSTGCHMLAPNGFWYSIKPRSSLVKRGVLTADNVIDQEYTGELIVSCFNTTDETIWLQPEERIAQVVFYKLYVPELIAVESLPNTARGSDGFGSTGVK